MFERVAWFALIYACISVTVTVLMLVFANKTFKLGGPFGMARAAGLIILAFVAVLIWIVKSLFGGQTGSLDDEVKSTIRKTSSWIEGLKDEWDKSKKG